MTHAAILFTHSDLEIRAALRHTVSSLEDLANKCRDRGIDPMTMIATAMAGDLGGSEAGDDAGTQAVAAPSAGDVELRVAPGSAPTPGDAEIARLSHDLIDAIGRADLGRVATMLAPGFVYFKDGAVIDRETMFTTLIQQRSTAPYIATRTWDHDRAARKGDTVVFSGKAHEVQGGNDSHGGYISRDGIWCNGSGPLRLGERSC